MKKYLESKYLIKTNVQNFVILYSTFTGSIIKLDSVRYDNFILGNYDSLKQEELKTLIDTGIILENQDNQYDLIVKRYNKNFYNKNRLNLTILTSEHCNLTCEYCFIYKYAGSDLTSEVSESVLKLIENKIDDSDKEKPFILKINFYGGEPLLNLNSIIKICEEVNKMKSKYENIKISYSIITNGVLLTNNVFEKLLNLGLSNYQITFDGPKEDHDKTRKFTNGKGSFDIIKNNLENIKNNFKLDNFNINLRINFLKYNYQNCFSLVDDLFDLIQNDKRFFVYCRAVANYDTSRDNIKVLEDDIFDKEEAVLKQAELTNYIISKFNLINSENLDTYYLPRPKNGWCLEDNSYSFIIGSTGLIYKCDTLLGEKEYSIGYLDNKGNINITGNEERNKSLFDTKYLLKCQNCSLLPICFGTCKRKILEKHEGSCYFDVKSIQDNIIKLINGKKEVKNGKD